MLVRQTEVIVTQRRQVKVIGSSMLPTLADGDLVLARLDAPVRPDDLVLVRWSRRPGQLSVKRAAWPEGDGWFVVGDNTAASTDSNQLGPAEVLGVIRWRLWPRPRRIR
ncbi:MAG TPA: S24/S26 family peptidase [Actinophytocola sp.]|uniref:S24/S26 family peptidase n=1 Tax=Actinophytocola sp. TaxID=1872138 RepID=UPI002DB6A891|nr:S24/S26 family peptidase [Actinophytocola sp.]HEU5473750.1 S24/S26 family peptidase [Actinophytocola sp.]